MRQHILVQRQGIEKEPLAPKRGTPQQSPQSDCARDHCHNLNLEKSQAWASRLSYRGCCLVAASVCTASRFALALASFAASSACQLPWLALPSKYRGSASERNRAALNTVQRAHQLFCRLSWSLLEPEQVFKQQDDSCVSLIPSQIKCRLLSAVPG